MIRVLALALVFLLVGCGNDFLFLAPLTIEPEAGSYFAPLNQELHFFSDRTVQITAHQVGGLPATIGQPCGQHETRSVIYDVVMRGPLVGTQATGELVATFNKDPDITATSVFVANWVNGAWLVEIRGTCTDGCRSGTMGGALVFTRGGTP